MKIRVGFVSNSSSSSFSIRLKDINGKQLDQIIAHSIDVDENEVRGSTMMDNFDMSEFLKRIGVPDEVIRWEN